MELPEELFCVDMKPAWEELKELGLKVQISEDWTSFKISMED